MLFFPKRGICSSHLILFNSIIVVSINHLSCPYLIILSEQREENNNKEIRRIAICPYLHFHITP
jgi:hypothetical protein